MIKSTDFDFEIFIILLYILEFVISPQIVSQLGYRNLWNLALYSNISLANTKLILFLSKYVSAIPTLEKSDNALYFIYFLL